jgi:CRP-like cAMP-binding protein
MANEQEGDGVIDPDRLRKVSVFADLSEDDLAWVAERMDERSIHAGGRVTEEGMPGYTFFAIEDGEAQVLHGDREIRRLSPGDVFGEGAIIGDGRRTADVVAATDLDLLAMPGTRFRELQMEMPELAASIEVGSARHRD